MSPARCGLGQNQQCLLPAHNRSRVTSFYLKPIWSPSKISVHQDSSLKSSHLQVSSKSFDRRTFCCTNGITPNRWLQILGFVWLSLGNQKIMVCKVCPWVASCCITVKRSLGQLTQRNWATQMDLAMTIMTGLKFNYSSSQSWMQAQMRMGDWRVVCCCSRGFSAQPSVWDVHKGLDKVGLQSIQSLHVNVQIFGQPSDWWEHVMKLKITFGQFFWHHVPKSFLKMGLDHHGSVDQ